MAKSKFGYICSTCAYKTTKWLGKCPNCESWGSIDEEVVVENISNIDKSQKKSAINLNEISIKKEYRLKTNFEEFDRVLGGGITIAEVVLITGAPGIGKSTFLLSLLNEYSKKNNCIYVTGEESLRQIKERADRINIKSDNIQILAETRLEYIIDEINTKAPKLVVIDSIQTLYSTEINSLPSSVSQIRECTLKLIEIAKEKKFLFIVGHITKDGKLAGPKLLEHMVDCVISFEGDANNLYRIVRSTKNRYGSTNEISIFDIKENCIEEIKNPSEFFISGRQEKNIGSTIVPSVEGSKVILFEVQSLVSKALYGYPKRIIEGLDRNRVEILLAILSKNMGVDFNLNDVYINIPGGVEIKERASDLAIALSLISSIKSIAISGKIAAIGELGLRGELRSVPFIKKRINELIKLGFTGIYVPKLHEEELMKEKYNIRISYIDNIKELIERIN